MENKEDGSASRRRQLPPIHLQPGRTSLSQSSSLRRTSQNNPAATHFASHSSAYGSRWGAPTSSPPPPPLLSQTLGSGGAAGGVGGSSASHAHASLPAGSGWEAGSSSSHQPQPPPLSETHGSGCGAGSVPGSSASWQSIYGSSSSYSYYFQDQAPPSLVGGSAFPQWQENLSGLSDYEMPPLSHPEELYPTSGGGVNGGGSGSVFLLWLDVAWPPVTHATRRHLHPVVWPPAYTTPPLSSSSVNQASSASGLLLHAPQSTASVFGQTHEDALPVPLPPLPPPMQTTAIYLPPMETIMEFDETAYISLLDGADLVSTHGVINSSSDDDTDNNTSTSTSVAASSPQPIPAQAVVNQEPVSWSPLVTSSSLPILAEAMVKQEPVAEATVKQELVAEAMMKQVLDLEIFESL
ncbi:hypothetical protein ACQJBY_040766 [Aegilops geniculata]